VAAFRLIPALRGILSCYNAIQNSLPCIDVLEEGLKVIDIEEQPGESVCFKDEINVNGLVFNYGSSDINLGNFKVKKGEYIGFRGYSGIGKTTLFNLLLGFLTPSKGEILIDGIALTRANRASWLKYIGYVPQDPYIFDCTIAQNIALGAEIPDLMKIEDVLGKVQLLDWVNSLPQKSNTMLGEGGSTLSGGQKQRISIARALYKGADVLLFDEATSSVDIATEKEINNMLRELKEGSPHLTILSIAHRESTLAYCTRIINLEENNG
jgi:ABC-type multidrug transport system fused ATPase/permease subunit